MLIFNSWYAPFLIVSGVPLKRVKNYRLFVIGCWVIGASCWTKKCLEFGTNPKFHEILRNKAACLKGGTWLFNEVENFVNWTWKRTFWENIICPIPKIETLELLDIFFASNFERNCNLDAKTTKNLPRQQLKVQDMLLEETQKISEISKFSILSYTQNRKLGKLGKCSFI